MDEQAMAEYISASFQNVETLDSMGYKFYFYGDDHRLPFATIACNGNEYEQASKLERPGTYRLNIGVSKWTFRDLFGAGEVSLEDYDFAELNRLMPHPDYWKQFFVCILSPEGENQTTVESLLAEAHDLSEKRYKKLHS